MRFENQDWHGMKTDSDERWIRLLLKLYIC
jgi:hypothetical protein